MSANAQAPRDAPARPRRPRREPGARAARTAAGRLGLDRRRAARAGAARCCGGCSPAGDWLALIAALCVATAATSTTDVATLFWAVLFSPAWILVLKLHGLYDNDHRRIRHSTLDELPALVSASVLGTLALDGLLALSPVGPLSPSSAIVVGVGALLGSFVAARRAALPLAPPDRRRASAS